MKKLLIIIFTIGIFFLDFAAIDDIRSGREVNLIMEYLVLGVSAAIFTGIGVLIYKNRKKFKALGK
jgi:hypothetical protein